MPVGYNGWENYETWNVALWLQNDEILYGLACQHHKFGELRVHLPDQTPDGVWYKDKRINRKEIDQLLMDLLD